MKSATLLYSLTYCLFVASASQAFAQVTLDWEFGPSEVTEVTTGTFVATTTAAATVNPISAPALVTVDSGPGGFGYYEGQFSNSPSFGTPTGVFDTIFGSYQLTLGARVQGAQAATYTLEFDQWVDTSFPGYPGPVVVTPTPNPADPVITLTPNQGQTSGGNWQRYSFTGTFSPGAGPLTLTITPDVSKQDYLGGLAIDRIKWIITGDLAPVPEPAMTACFAAAGLALFAVWRRRQQAV